MKQFRRHIAVAVAAAVLAGIMAGTGLFALGCGGSAVQVDPAAVLSGSAAKMKLVKGFHLVYEVHKPAGTKPGSGLEIARITGDVNSDGNMQAAIDVTQGNVPLTLNFVQVGDTQYLQMGAWQKIPVENSPVGKLTLGASTVQILQQVTGAQYVGEEKKAGAKCYHISGQRARGGSQGHLPIHDDHYAVSRRYLDRDNGQLHLRGRYPRPRHGRRAGGYLA